MSIEGFYKEHYTSIRRQLMGKPMRQPRVTPPEKPVIVEELPAKITVDPWAEFKFRSKSLEIKRQRCIEQAVIAYREGHKISPDAIIAAVANEHGMTHSLIISEDRFRKTVIVRDKAIRAVHEAYPKKGWKELGRIFHRDHASIMHSLRKTGHVPLKNKKPNSQQQ